MAQSDPLLRRRIPQQSTKSDTILIADDDEFFRMALRTILTKIVENADVIETSSLDEAVERLAETGSVSSRSSTWPCRGWKAPRAFGR